MDVSQQHTVGIMATNFLKSLDKFGTVYVKPTGATREDPLTKMRRLFGEKAAVELKALSSGKIGEKSRWVKKLTDGQIVVSLRNGNALIPLGQGDATHRAFKTAKDAAAFITAAAEAVAAKELDDLLEMTARAKNKPVAGAAAKKTAKKK